MHEFSDGVDYGLAGEPGLAMDTDAIDILRNTIQYNTAQNWHDWIYILFSFSTW